MASKSVRQSRAATRAAADCCTRLRATKAVLADREAELLDLKGPCSSCRLHYAHSGPCDVDQAKAGSDG